jgi:hypothetical protein
VDALVIHALEPGPQGDVEFDQAGDVGGLDFRQELEPQGFKEAFRFAFGFRRVGRGLDALDAEGGAGGIEWHGRAMIFVSAIMLQRSLEADMFSVSADRKSTRLNSSHRLTSRMPSSA